MVLYSRCESEQLLDRNGHDGLDQDGRMRELNTRCLDLSACVSPKLSVYATRPWTDAAGLHGAGLVKPAQQGFVLCN